MHSCSRRACSLHPLSCSLEPGTGKPAPLGGWGGQQRSFPTVAVACRPRAGQPREHAAAPCKQILERPLPVGWAARAQHLVNKEAEAQRVLKAVWQEGWNQGHVFPPQIRPSGHPSMDSGKQRGQRSCKEKRLPPLPPLTNP